MPLRLRVQPLCVWLVCMLFFASSPFPLFSKEMPKPSEEFQATFSGCQWKNVQNKLLSIWSFHCKSQHLEADDNLPGFRLKSTDADGSSQSVAIHAFLKPAASSIEHILPAVRLASPGPHTQTCAFVPVKMDPPSRAKRYTLEPTGEAKKKWQRDEAKGEDVEPPCGPYGVYFVGDRYFEILDTRPDVVLYYDMGSEVQIFDPSTLKIKSSN